MNTGIFKIKYHQHVIFTTLIEGCIYLRVADIDHFFAFDDIELIKKDDYVGVGNVANVNNHHYADVTGLMVLFFNELISRDIRNTKYAESMRKFCNWLVSPEFNRQVMEYVSGWCLMWDTSDHSHFLKYTDRNREVTDLNGICNNSVKSNQTFHIPYEAGNQPLEEILGETLQAVEAQKANVMDRKREPFYWGNIRCQQLPSKALHGKSRLLRNGFWTYNHYLLVVYQQFLTL